MLIGLGPNVNVAREYLIFFPSTVIRRSRTLVVRSSGSLSLKSADADRSASPERAVAPRRDEFRASEPRPFRSHRSTNRDDGTSERASERERERETLISRASVEAFSGEVRSPRQSPPLRRGHSTSGVETWRFCLAVQRRPHSTSGRVLFYWAERCQIWVARDAPPPSPPGLPHIPTALPLLPPAPPEARPGRSDFNVRRIKSRRENSAGRRALWPADRFLTDPV